MAAGTQHIPQRQPVSAFLTPPGTFFLVVETGQQKAKMTFWRVFWLGILAGAYIGISCVFFLSLGGQMPEEQATNPGLQKLVLGAFGLPMALGLILICGSELLTANSLYISAAVFEGKATVAQLFYNLFFCFWGNLCGSLLIVGLAYATGLFQSQPAGLKYSQNLSYMKATTEWGRVVARGVLCNWLVCLAVWQSAAAQDITGKLAAVFFPVMAFVSTGFDHVVANMFLVPWGMRLGNGITVGHYIWHSMIPTFIGNFTASVIMISFTYSMCYGTLPARISDIYGSWRKQRSRSKSNPINNSKEVAGANQNGHSLPV